MHAGKMLEAHSHTLSSCQAVDSLINTWEEKCQSWGQVSRHLGMGPPPDQRVTDCTGCHLCRFHYVVTSPASRSSGKKEHDSRNFPPHLGTTSLKGLALVFCLCVCVRGHIPEETKVGFGCLSLEPVTFYLFVYFLLDRVPHGSRLDSGRI